MTVRQRHRRRAVAWRRNRGGNTISPQKRGKDMPLRPKEKRQLLQLMVCSGIFVFLVVVKLLLPTHMAQFNQALAGAMERNMDVKAVFSAIGGVFSKEKDVADTAEEIYQAVLKPEKTTEALKTGVFLPETGLAMRSLQSYRTIEQSPGESEEQEEVQVASLAYVLYSDQNLPECVSMEQAILDFAYCTPVNGVLSSDFGYREHPVEGEDRFHYGIDLSAETGTDIVCFADGTVTAVGESSSYGKYCVVRHNGGYATLYAHCSRVVATSGTAVKKGQKIAEVGESGIATGPHLHFELQRDETYLNPIYYVTQT